MKKKFSFDYVLAILWGVCLLLNVANMAAGEPQGNYTYMLITHICLVLAHIRLGMKDN